MKQTVKAYWALLSQYCNTLRENGVPVCLQEEKYTTYEKDFSKAYQNYMVKYMRPETENLDRHKVAALLITVGMEDNIIYEKGDVNSFEGNSNEIFIGKQKVLLLCALDYIMQSLNALLDENGFLADHNMKPMEVFQLPEAWACKTPFINVISRTAYYAETDFLLNPMELAEKLFLLEYISILLNYRERAQEVFEYLREGAHPDVNQNR